MKQKRIDWKIGVPVLIVAMIITFLATWLLRPQPEKQVIRFSHIPPSTVTVGSFNLAISPDGKNIVYGANIGDVDHHLYIRRIDQLEEMPIDDTEGALGAIFSPDGRELAFYADGQLKRVRIDGGPAETACDISSTPLWGTWGDDGTIIYADIDSGLSRVPASGGIPEVILRPDSGKMGSYFRLPELLPGSKAVLYTVWEGRTPDEANIAVLNLETGESEILIEGGTWPLYSPTGHILFGRSGACWAVPFDAKKLRITGQEVRIQEGVSIGGFGNMGLRFSNNGTLVYLPTATVEERTLVLVDRNGVETPLTDRKNNYAEPRFSPDGTRVAVSITDDVNNSDNIWIHDIDRNIPTLLTSEGTVNRCPNWSPDGMIYFTSNRSGVEQIYRKRADGIGEAELLWPSENTQVPGTWSDDGTLFAFYEIHPTTQRDLWIYTTKDSTASPFLVTQDSEFSPTISPDGKWIAYVLGPAWDGEIYITPYPGPGERKRISTQGGTQPVWARDGSELFYREGNNKIMAVSIETQPSLRPGIPELLFEESYWYPNVTVPQYDIHPDGNRFLMLKSVEDESGSGTPQINIVLNWFEVLKEKMAGAGE